MGREWQLTSHPIPTPTSTPLCPRAAPINNPSLSPPSPLTLPPTLQQLVDQGYSTSDIITTVFRVVRNSQIAEFLKLEFLKVQGGAGPVGGQL